MLTEKDYKKEEFEEVIYFESAPEYEIEDLVKLYKLQHLFRENPEKREQAYKDAIVLRNKMGKKEKHEEKIYLWKEDNIPTETKSFTNENYKYHHNFDFKPYMYAMLVEENVTPKGAVVVIAGGDHGACVFPEAYETCRDFNKLGYQAFFLLNRPNHNPWTRKESGADTARAIQIIRKNASKYRIKENTIAVAGFSNGGLTGDSCIRYYSKHKIADYFEEYTEEEYDTYSPSPDAFLCIYGPRFHKDPWNNNEVDEVDYSSLQYPPVFLAVGREDSAMNNLATYYPELLEHGVTVEIHTFAGTPHGQAGMKIIDGYEKYPNFNLWLPLADAFMLDAYNKKDNNK